VELTPRRVLTVFVALNLGMILSTLDGTIVATALPAIARDVGGFDHVSWVFTMYLLALIASMPLYGKFGDLFGRKRILLIAIALFLTGSMLCGAAQTMPELLAFRFLQGLGGGGLGTLAMAILADIVPARQLGRWLGYQGVMFAVASVAGPLVGGLFVDHIGWRWAFYINLPLGLFAAALVWLSVQVPYRRIPHAFDWLGSALLTAALVGFALVATLGGRDLSWTSPLTALLAIASLAAGVTLVRWERRAAEPVLPMQLFANPVVRVTACINFTSGLLLWCGIFFVPLFVQEVAGAGATNSGLVLMPLMFSTAIGTLVAGRSVERLGRYRTWPIAGSVLMTLGVALLAMLGRSTPAVVVACFAGVLGTGVGFVMQTSLLAMQNSVENRELGIATSTALLLRTLGGTIGVPIFGSILNAGLPAGGHASRAAFAHAFPPVFLAAVPVGIVSIVVSLRLQDRPLREHAHFAPATIEA
jgi:EmrB/QacA subfamily drug resistance transporter